MRKIGISSRAGISGPGPVARQMGSTLSLTSRRVSSSKSRPAAASYEIESRVCLDCACYRPARPGLADRIG